MLRIYMLCKNWYWSFDRVLEDDRHLKRKLLSNLTNKSRKNLFNLSFQFNARWLSKLFNNLVNFRIDVMSKIRQCVKNHFNWFSFSKITKYMNHLLHNNLFLIKDQNIVNAQQENFVSYIDYVKFKKKMFKLIILSKCVEKIFFDQLNKNFDFARRDATRS